MHLFLGMGDSSASLCSLGQHRWGLDSGRFCLCVFLGVEEKRLVTLRHVFIRIN